MKQSWYIDVVLIWKLIISKMLFRKFMDSFFIRFIDEKVQLMSYNCLVCDERHLFLIYIPSTCIWKKPAQNLVAIFLHLQNHQTVYPKQRRKKTTPNQLLITGH